MAGTRLDLHTKLVELLGPDAKYDASGMVENVYFQPPSTIKLKYPCIIYKRDDQYEAFAGNSLYVGMKRYSITVIDKNPDSTIPDRMMGLRYCTFNAHYAVDNLNHDSYTLYF